VITWDREQIRKQRHRFLVIDAALARQDIKLIQLRRGTVLTGQPRSLPQNIDRRIKRGIGMVRGTLKLHPLGIVIGKAITQTIGNSRFSDASLPTEEHDLSFAANSFVPATQQECDLLFSADKTG
jgi:hypothetical protein